MAQFFNGAIEQGPAATGHVAVNGEPEALSLLDTSRRMLDRAVQALAVRQAKPTVLAEPLESVSPSERDEALVAHVIEHFENPRDALGQFRSQLRRRGVLRLVVSKPHW